MAYEPFNISSERSQEILTEMLHVAFSRQIPDAMLLSSNAKIRIFELATGGLVAQLSGWLLDGHKQDVRTEVDVIEFPSSPWQFLKQRHAPEWFLKRWPVVMEERRIRVAVHHHYVCPHVRVEDRGKHFMWMGRMSGQVGADSGAL
jgi:hypothetical protein